MDQTIQVFCCYAREDKSSLLVLKKHLKPFQRDGLITVQADIDVSPGEDWEQRINHFLNTARVILLLISPDFIDSDYCYSKEMLRAMERHENGEACVIPILLRPARWRGTLFGKLQVLPTDAEAVTSKYWHTPDDAFFDVTMGIEKVIEKLLIQLYPRKVALFGYETQGGSASALWTNPGVFSLNENEAYLKWSGTKRSLTEEEIVGHTWVKAGDHGYYFIIHFLPSGQLRESRFWDRDSQAQGSWELTDGILRIHTEQCEDSVLVKYELDIFANRNGLVHTGVEFQNGKKTAHAYFVCLLAESATKHHEAIMAFNQLLRVNQNCIEAYKAKGDILRDLGPERYEEAIVAYREALNIEQKSAEMYYDLGNALYHLQGYNEAVVAYKRATELKADFAVAYYDLGNALFQLQRYEEAMAAYEQGIHWGFGTSVASYDLGNALYRLHRYEEALAAYERSIELDPTLAVASYDKGNALFHLQRYEEALSSYNQAIEHGFHNAVVYYDLGNALQCLQRREEALIAYGKAYQLDPNQIGAYLGQGKVYLDLGRFEDALAVYEQATQVAPHNTWTWHDKGQALGHLQRAEEALEAFERAIEFDPNNKWAWFHKAETLTHLARQAYQKAGQPGREPLKRDYYNLIQRATGKCLDGNGSSVYMHEPNGGSYQLWKATEGSLGTIVLKHFWSGKVLEATVERGTYLSEYTDSPSQQWILEGCDDGYKKLRQVATGMVLHGDANNDVYLQPDNGGNFQAWIAAKIHITPFIAPHDSSNAAKTLVFEQERSFNSI